MAKYQPKHKAPRKRRGNEHTADVWAIAFVLAGLSIVPIVKFNGVFGLITLSLWSTLFNVIGTFGVLWVVFAVAVAMFAIWNIDRENKNARTHH